jgi:hypothetical protein
MIGKFLTQLFGSKNERELKKLQPSGGSHQCPGAGDEGDERPAAQRPDAAL